MKKYAKLDSDLLSEVKQAFVQMPAGAGGPGPVAGGGMMTQAQAGPMGAPMAGAPPMGPPPGGDPMMGGAPPMDPMMGGAPPPGGDPMMGGAPPPEGELPPEAMAALAGAMGGGGQEDGRTITLSVDELIRLIEGIVGATKGKRTAAAPTDAAPEAAAPAPDPLAALGGGGPAPAM